MMLTSKPVKGEEAFSLGLVDAIVPREELISAARKWALDISERRKPWIISLHKTNKLESLADAREIFKFARAQVRKQAPNLKHPLVCIDVVETGVVSGPRAGLQKEIEDFQVLLHADTSKSLIHVFFAQRGTTKVPGVSDLGLTPRRINKVAVIGGGLMGSGIATALILSNYPVILKEVNEKFLEAGLGRVKANLQSRVRKGTMTPEKFERTISLLKGVLDYESFKDVDMVIEVSSSQRLQEPNGQSISNFRKSSSITFKSMNQPTKSQRLLRQSTRCKSQLSENELSVFRTNQDPHLGSRQSPFIRQRAKLLQP
ncbi:glyoxysomal fatty acid beta-oxidation multifunctional protein MFP-a-like [Cucumis sativus]|uniref:glyoxysomal fatty acid beta-oxidation multifunctional protein MFP-a-like n=1 Tax=Cucumis sativus TaxID=3659 RepID=UPI0012F4E92F|nr:glyoxysomal fatty acid beta-oxidation multifunctional protein MFP-a-like [Cucumis sativus]